jgi:hypothetical protein
MESDYCNLITIVAQQDGEMHRLQIEFNEGVQTITGYEAFTEFIDAKNMPMPHD